MKAIILTIFIISVFLLRGYSQTETDSIILYYCRSKQVVKIPSPVTSNSREFDYTSLNFGMDDKQSLLDTINPPGSGFSGVTPAQTFFEISDYPVRTTVKMYRYVNGMLDKSFTGTMVAPNLVLTCAHGVFEFDEEIYFDSILAVPAFDFNHQVSNSLFGGSISSKYYIARNYWRHDLALIELQKPIGLQTGWIGIAFQTNDQVLEKLVVHKFSYPREDRSDPDHFNGDTLFYSYGNINYIDNEDIGHYGGGYLGQSGSSLFYTNNKIYYILGVQSYSSTTRSFNSRITKNMFYALKNIIDQNIATNIISFRKQFLKKNIHHNFPNPFCRITTIQFSVQYPSYISLKIFNPSGKLITTLIEGYEQPGCYNIHWNANDLQAGVYLSALKIGDQLNTIKLIKLNHDQ